MESWIFIKRSMVYYIIFFTCKMCSSEVLRNPTSWGITPASITSSIGGLGSKSSNVDYWNFREYHGGLLLLSYYHMSIKHHVNMIILTKFQKFLKPEKCSKIFNLLIHKKIWKSWNIQKMMICAVPFSKTIPMVCICP